MEIESYVDESGDNRWRAIAKNGNIVAGPQEGYRNMGDMHGTLRGIQEELPSAIADYLGQPVMTPYEARELLLAAQKNRKTASGSVSRSKLALWMIDAVMEAANRYRRKP